MAKLRLYSEFRGGSCCAVHRCGAVYGCLRAITYDMGRVRIEVSKNPFVAAVATVIVAAVIVLVALIH